MELVGKAVINGARKKKACDTLGVSARTMERWEQEPEKGDLRRGPKTEPANKLTMQEQEKVIGICTSEEFKDLPPTQIVPRLADRGQYVASEATFYRVLKAEKLLAHRDDTKPKNGHKPEEHIATAPNQVWSWDITYLKTSVKGLFFYLYMIMDVFTRKIVGWDIHMEENSEHAAILAEITCMVEGIDFLQLILHSDNGSAQKGATMLGTLQKLGVVPSFSRPSVSNDNPYSESLFKTMKYRPSYPERAFESIDQAKEWVEAFVEWYNTEHLHSGIKFVTPQERHTGLDINILERRHQVYEAARAKAPHRWSGKTRNWDPIEYVLLNPLKSTRQMYTLGECIV
jgi:putative transposase